MPQTTLTKYRTDQLTPHYRWNFGAALVHGVFFLAANAFTSPTVVLPAFVAMLTPSEIMIGLPMSIILGRASPASVIRRPLGRAPTSEKTLSRSGGHFQLK